ncbi:hypothetical protein ACFL48_04185 [Pseudomonadota bacterium]
MGSRYKTHRSILVVGEGPADACFIRHLRDLYCPREAKVQPLIREEHGGSPKDIVDYAIQQSKQKEVSSITVVMDRDCAWGQLPGTTGRKQIKKIGASPCLEGELLRILGRSVPASSRGCKRELDRMGIDVLDIYSYQRNFPKHVLDAARERVSYLGDILDNIAPIQG